MNTWTQMIIGADENKLVCYFHNMDTDKMEKCYDKEVARPARPANYRIGIL